MPGRPGGAEHEEVIHAGVAEDSIVLRQVPFDCHVRHELRQVNARIHPFTPHRMVRLVELRRDRESARK